MSVIPLQSNPLQRCHFTYFLKARRFRHSSQNTMSETVHTLMVKPTSGLHTLSVWHTVSTWLGIKLTLEVEVICPVEQVDHNKRQGEGDSGVVVYVVRVLHVATIYGAEHFAEDGQGGEAPVGGLRLWWLCLRLGLTARGAGRVDCEFQRGWCRGRGCCGLFTSLGPTGVTWDCSDHAIPVVVKIVHVMAVLQRNVWDQ